MPKKKTPEKNVKKKNNSNDEKVDESKKEESDLEKHEEESELEEEVEDSNLDLQNLEFHQFMQLSSESQKGVPVLERIAGSAPKPIFVGGISSGTDSKDEFRYVPGAAENTETKYFSEPRTENTPQRVDFTNIGRNDGFREEANQERFFRQSGPRTESQSPERFERVERFDAEKEGRGNLFERPEEKYEKYRPKLPK